MTSDLQTKLATQDILERSSNQPIYLSSIEVVGGETFSSNFFKKILSPLSEKSDYTLGQLLQKIDILYGRLMKTDVFKTVDITLHSDYAKSLPKVALYNNEPSIPTKVVFDLSSVALNCGQAFLNLNNDDILNVNLNYLNNNFFENAEMINLGVNYNPYKPNQHLFSNGKLALNLPNPSFKLLTDFYNTNSNNQLWQQSTEHTSGLFSGLQYISNCKKFTGVLGLSVDKRLLTDIHDGASDDLKFFGGDFLRKAIVNQLLYTNLSYLNTITRNFPTDGYLVQVSNEIATNQEASTNADSGSSNPASFVKSSISTDVFKSLFNNAITTHFSLDMGGIFSKSEKFPIHPSDRFYLGGYNSFRGFTKNSVNQSGGLQFAKASATIYSKLPSFIYSPVSFKDSKLQDGRGYEANPLRLYVSGGAGSVSNNILEDNSGIATNVGVGLRYFNNWANFDIGYFVAKRQNGETAGIKDGFQFSVSIGGSNSTI